MIISTHIVIRDGGRLPIMKSPDWEIDGDAELLMRKMLYNTACTIAKHEFPTDNAKFEARILELFNSVMKKPYPI